MENDNLKKLIGNRINGLLASYDKTQKALADAIGVKPNVISYFCKGTRTPNTEQIVKIADFFNVSSDYLLGLAKDPTNDNLLQDFCKYTGLSGEVIQQIELINKMGYIDVFNTVSLWLTRKVMLENIQNIFEAASNFKDDIDVSNEIFNEFVKNMSDPLFKQLFLCDKKHILLHLESACQSKYENKIDYYHYKIQKSLEFAINDYEMEISKAGISEMANKIYSRYLDYCKEDPENGKHNPPERIKTAL